MKELWKKAGIILGHVVCIIIILFCIVYSQSVYEEENQTANQQEDLVSTTKIPTKETTPTPIEVPTPTPLPTETPVPTEALEETEVIIPTQALEVTDIPVITQTPEVTETPVPTEMPEVTETPIEESLTEREAVKLQVLTNITDGVYKEINNDKDGWWFRRKKDHVPSGTGEQFDIGEYQGYYLQEKVDNGDKVIYMTIDCGYRSDNTEKMLDIFKKHDVKVMFFVTKHFIDASPKEVRRMVEEGHMVGNHSVTHADLTELTDEEIVEEILGCEEAFYEVTGKQMDLYFRPPEGAYSKRTMQITKDLGYKTIFWSIAYNDYDKKNQPGKDFVIEHFDTYHHNGAIPLMHNDSQSNLEAMDEVLTFLEEQGYRFGTLSELK